MLGACYLLQDFLNTCKHDSTDFVEISMRGLLPVIDAKRKDSLHEFMSSWKPTTFFAYKSCLSTYTPKAHIDRHLKRSALDVSRTGNVSTVKRIKGSDIPLFQWLNQCRVEKNVTSRSIQSIQIKGINHMNVEYWREVKESCSRKIFCRCISFFFSHIEKEIEKEELFYHAKD